MAWLSPVFVNNGFLSCEELHNRGFIAFPLNELCACKVRRRRRRPRPLSDRGKITFATVIQICHSHFDATCNRVDYVSFYHSRHVLP